MCIIWTRRNVRRNNIMSMIYFYCVLYLSEMLFLKIMIQYDQYDSRIQFISKYVLYCLLKMKISNVHCRSCIDSGSDLCTQKTCLIQNTYYSTVFIIKYNRIIQCKLVRIQKI